MEGNLVKFTAAVVVFGFLSFVSADVQAQSRAPKPDAQCPVTTPNGIAAGEDQVDPGSFGNPQVSVGIEALDRLVRAISNPHVCVVGHPTGRLVPARRGLEPDMGKVIFAAARHGVALEINAHYYRLDLRDSHARMAVEAQVPLDAPWNTPNAEALDAQTIASWLTHVRVPTKTARDLLTATFRALFASELNEVSLLNALLLINSGGGLINFMQVSDGYQDSQIEGGMQTMANGMAAELGDALVLNAPVRGIRVPR